MHQSDMNINSQRLDKGGNIVRILFKTNVDSISIHLYSTSHGFG